MSFAPTITTADEHVASTDSNLPTFTGRSGEVGQCGG
jgi:hypothetical protein